MIRAFFMDEDQPAAGIESLFRTRRLAIPANVEVRLPLFTASRASPLRSAWAWRLWLSSTREFKVCQNFQCQVGVRFGDLELYAAHGIRKEPIHSHYSGVGNGRSNPALLERESTQIGLGSVIE